MIFAKPGGFIVSIEVPLAILAAEIWADNFCC